MQCVVVTCNNFDKLDIEIYILDVAAYSNIYLLLHGFFIERHNLQCNKTAVYFFPISSIAFYYFYTTCIFTKVNMPFFNFYFTGTFHKELK